MASREHTRPDGCEVVERSPRGGHSALGDGFLGAALLNWRQVDGRAGGTGGGLVLAFYKICPSTSGRSQVCTYTGISRSVLKWIL